MTELGYPRSIDISLIFIISQPAQLGILALIIHHYYLPITKGVGEISLPASTSKTLKFQYMTLLRGIHYETGWLARCDEIMLGSAKEVRIGKTKLLQCFMSTAPLACPTCNSTDVVKNGKIHNGKQNFRCRECGRQFVQDPQNKIIAQASKTLIDKLLLEKISRSGIARVVDVSEPWLQSYVNEKYQNLPSKRASTS